MMGVLGIRLVNIDLEEFVVRFAAIILIAYISLFEMIIPTYVLSFWKFESIKTFSETPVTPCPAASMRKYRLKSMGP